LFEGWRKELTPASQNAPSLKEGNSKQAESRFDQFPVDIYTQPRFNGSRYHATSVGHPYRSNARWHRLCYRSRVSGYATSESFSNAYVQASITREVKLRPPTTWKIGSYLGKRCS